jgi:hypothetical protein
MFYGEDRIKVKTSLEFNKVLQRVEDALDRVGRVKMYESGDFTISGSRLANFLTEIHLEGEVEQKKDGDTYVVHVEYKIEPSVACWVIGIIGFICGLVGALVFLAPVLAQGEVKRVVEKGLDDVRRELEE